MQGVAPRVAGQCAYRGLRPNDHVARLRARLVHVVHKVLAHPIRKPVRNGQIELVRAAYDAEPAVSWVVIAQGNRRREERCPYLSVEAFVLKFRHQTTSRTNRSTMEGEALRVGGLCDEQRLMIETVTFAEQAAIVGHELWVGQHVPKEIR